MPVIWRTHTVKHVATQYGGTGETGMEQARLEYSGVVQLRSPVLQKGAGYKGPPRVWFYV